MDLFDYDCTTKDEILSLQAPGKVPNCSIELFPTGKTARIRANIEAISLLKKLDIEKRSATQEEKNILKKYSGWGGVHAVFDEKHKDNGMLRCLLTSSEYRTARGSILDSYYTPVRLIESMWKIAGNFGFWGGKCLEPGAGTGNFMGLALGNCKFTAVEVENVSAGIMKKVYPEADIRHESLENVQLNSNYNLVIGNVPFGKTGVYDRNYKNYNLHNYFIARSLDTLKDGGLAVLLTSSATMDSNDSTARACFGKKAGLVGAIRLPNNIFPETEVVADILIFRKGSQGNAFLNLKEIDTQDNTGKMKLNEYFADNQQMILGIPSNTGKMYGKLNSPTIFPREGKFESEMEQIVANIL